MLHFRWESSTDREQDLLYKNQLLQDEIAMLRLELTQFKNLNFICHQKAMLNEDFPENVMNAFACKSSSIVTSLTCKKPTRACLCSCQWEEMQNKRIMKEKIVDYGQEHFNDIFNKLRADTEKQVYLIEERNKDLNAKRTDLREQVFKYETDVVERQGMFGQLQQELAAALKKQSMPEASLEVTTRYHSDLEREKLRLQKELEKTVKTKTQKQNMLALTSKDLHSTWEEHLKSRSHLEERVAQLDEEKAELLQQVDELSQQLEIEPKKGMQLEAQNHDLREELSTMRGNHEKLEKSKSQLKEEVANLKHHMETNMVDRSQIEQSKREVEE
ncbi:ankyrin repeat domain-containing protein 26-like [Falco cherrug]|uniref:ankyrin repeat domain-containing protein 26-like n=1 Tax=Falco cherrug TaxID=345164 RepID=UPI00247AD0F7|nr:ankyrin repeat domain-containing protein 26-like [Falco cherrug]